MSTATRICPLAVTRLRPVVMVIVDTGPLVAAADSDDDDHRSCVDLLTGLRLAERPLLISPVVVAEVTYTIGRTGGSAAEAVFINSIRSADFPSST